MRGDMHKWQLYEAKNKLSSLIDGASSGQPQYIMRRGKDAAVIIGIKEYQKLKKQHSLKDFLLSGDKFDNLEIDRAIGRLSSRLPLIPYL
jgi:prevent-host-death family protein